ncbi:MAG: hypothetical protein ACFFD9_08980 [Candidatus Thorarchaeota archaeon]
MRIRTPYDDMIPSVPEPSARFYIDMMRIYLGLYEGVLSVEDAVNAADTLKENPEYAKFPVDPTVIPLTEEFKERILSNLLTLKKFNLFTRDSIRSAFTFALLTPETPINETDFQMLRVLEVDPLSTLVDASSKIGATPRTAARSIERLERNQFLRVSAFMDMTSFGAYPYILFFTLADGVDWETVEKGLALFPFTKNILKTTTTDLGYVSFLIPGPAKSLDLFTEHIRDISPILFDYSSLHVQEASGADTNLSLFKNDQWRFSDTVLKVAEGQIPSKHDSTIKLLKCKEWQGGLTSEDFIVTSEYSKALRDPPRILREKLRMEGWEIEAKQITQSIRKSHDRNLILPFISFRGLGLSTNFCFEIICDIAIRNQILEAIVHLPSVIYFLSSRGIIVWAQVPSHHQVEYYRMFRSLENLEGVDSVQPIMTIMLKGSRSELDFVRLWKFGSRGWTVDSDLLDLASCFPY